VIGGYRAVGVTASSAIYSFSPATAQVKLVGLLPLRLAGAMAISRPRGILLAGGVEPSGQTSSTIYRVEIGERTTRSRSSG
jgi:N-acetylneuraminic acid mutarotase